MGEEAFLWSSVLKNSAAASLAIASIDLHMAILNNMYEAVSLCENSGDGSDLFWDSAVAATVGWTEGAEEGGSGIDGYLFFQLAQELCEHFDSCEVDGVPLVNTNLMEEFKNGQEALKNGQCDDAKNSQVQIEKYLQSILVDSLAYHTRFADSNPDEIHCLMAHVAKNAIVPLIRSNSQTADAATAIESNVGATAVDCKVDDVDAVYQALNQYVTVQGISCTWLGSSVCNGTSMTPDSVGYEDNTGYTANTDEQHTIFNDEYKPITDMKSVLDISSVVGAICNTESTDAAKETYTRDETAGLSIEAMSATAKFVMNDELQLNQYVYALQDGVDKTDSSLLFDNKPATEYANTITSDALDTSTALACRSVKVLNIWMWIVHKRKSPCF